MRAGISATASHRPGWNAKSASSKSDADAVRASIEPSTDERGGRMAGNANIILCDPRIREAAEVEQKLKVAELLDSLKLPTNIGELRSCLNRAYLAGFCSGANASVGKFRQLAPDLFEPAHV
jgi:hypothetical protein